MHFKTRVLENTINHTYLWKYWFFDIKGHTKNVWLYGPHVNIYTYVKITVTENCVT